MAEMEDKLNSILSDPNMMQKIMSMAQALEGGPPKIEECEKNGTARQEQVLPDIDLATVQRITGLAKQTGVDKREQALLRALAGYLSKERINRLEKAMRAAKMAKVATSALNQKGIFGFQGR